MNQKQKSVPVAEAVVAAPPELSPAKLDSSVIEKIDAAVEQDPMVYTCQTRMLGVGCPLVKKCPLYSTDPAKFMNAKEIRRSEAMKLPR